MFVIKRFNVKNLLSLRLYPKQIDNIDVTGYGTMNLSSTTTPSNTASSAANAEEFAAACKLNVNYGQPTAVTHPHLIGSNELVPGIHVAELQQRRWQFLINIQKYAVENLQHEILNSKNHLVIMPSSTKKYMSDKIPYIFRQNSDFYYLTGCLEPDTVLMLNINEKQEMKTMIFMRPKDKHAELWEGSRTGIELALNLFGVDEAYSISNLSHILGKYIQYENPTVWYDSQHSDLLVVNDYISKVSELTNTKIVLKSPQFHIQKMRLIKSPAEQKLMKTTCRIASEAINDVMLHARPGHSEHHIFAMVDYQCRMRNANHLAYPPVVASGNNATTIHYINNNQVTKVNDLVLMDAGCEYGGYSSDITRTWPISGEFTNAQKLLYEVVLQLQKDLLSIMLQPGGRTLDELFQTSCIKLAKYLQEISLVPKHITNKTELSKIAYDFCPHHVSHYLGMDVHDTPLISRSIQLIPGMVCTIEPGVYISRDRVDLPQEFRGMGVRIEDDVLINNENKVELLTGKCWKEVTDIGNLHKANQTKVKTNTEKIF